MSLMKKKLNFHFFFISLYSGVASFCRQSNPSHSSVGRGTISDHSINNLQLFSFLNDYPAISFASENVCCFPRRILELSHSKQNNTHKATHLYLQKTLRVMCGDPSFFSLSIGFTVIACIPDFVSFCGSVM